MRSLAGKRVLVTGAAAGIGRRLAEGLAADGALLVLVDRHATPLEETAAACRAKGVDVRSFALDLTDAAAVAAMVRAVQAAGGIDILVNNAGIGHAGELADTPLETWRRLMDVNFWAPLALTYAFLPAWLERGHGHVVNISSGQAFFRLPTWGPYTISKLALGAFSELLGIETAGRGLRVTTVYPFMVNTGFYDGIKGESVMGKLSMRLVPYYSMSPERVAERILAAIRREKRLEFVSALNGAGVAMRALPPLADLTGRLAYRMLGKR